MGDIVDLQKVRYHRENSKRLAAWVRRMLDQGTPEAAPRTPRETNIVCLKCGAPVKVISRAYTCDDCGHSMSFVQFDTIDTR